VSLFFPTVIVQNSCHCDCIAFKLLHNSSVWLMRPAAVLADRDMGARHRARTSTIQIMRCEEVAASKTRRPNIKQFHVSSLRLLLGAQHAEPFRVFYSSVGKSRCVLPLCLKFGSTSFCVLIW